MAITIAYWQLCCLIIAAFAAAAPTKLIIDTDIGGGGCNDVDDVVAVCIAHALMDNGEADLIAVVQNTAPLTCAGAISVLNHFYGRDSVPIGAYNISTPGADLMQQQPLSYVPSIVDTFDSPIKNSTDAFVSDAVATYRAALASSPDRSVAISSIGIHTNLAALLKSTGDRYSPLSGVDLVAKKTFLLAVMGGTYPLGGGECNLEGGGDQGFGLHNHEVASAASSYVAAHWPSESSIIWSGSEVGVLVQSGGKGFQSRCPSVADPRTNPCAAAIIAYEGGPNKSRFSWDPLTTLVAVRSIAGVPSVAACTECNGVNVIDATTGHNRWQRQKKPAGSANSNQTYLVLRDGKAAGDALDELLCQRAKLNPHPAPSHPRPQPQPQPPAGLCELTAIAASGASPPMSGFGGGNFTAAWDDDVRTFFDYSHANGGWTEASLDGESNAIAHIEFFPRGGGSEYMRRAVGGTFVGIKADASSVELGTIAIAPGDHWNTLSIDAKASQEPVVGVRYNSPKGGYGNIAEIKLYKRCTSTQ